MIKKIKMKVCQIMLTYHYNALNSLNKHNNKYEKYYTDSVKKIKYWKKVMDSYGME